MKRTLIIGAAAAAALLPMSAAYAQVSIGVRTPEFAFRIGAPGPAFAPTPFFGVPVFAPPIGAPVFGPPAFGPVFVPAPVFVPRPRVFVPAPVFVRPPRWVAVPRRHPGFYGAPGYYGQPNRVVPGSSYGPPNHNAHHGQYAQWAPPGQAGRY